MDDLPNELIPLIVKHLGFKDLIKCRLVSNRFMFFCDEVQIPEIIISDKIENIKNYWFYSSKQFNYKGKYQSKLTIDVRN